MCRCKQNHYKYSIAISVIGNNYVGRFLIEICLYKSQFRYKLRLRCFSNNCVGEINQVRYVLKVRCKMNVDCKSQTICIWVHLLRNV